jgi:mono/diheme cytochrome c family protein
MSRHFFSVVVLSLLGACGTARRSEPVRGPLAVTSDLEREGQRVFMRECNYCHPMGDGGLGPGLNNKPVPKAAVQLQIRKGMGAMPSFSESELSDGDIEALFAYMLVMRRHD